MAALYLLHAATETLTLFLFAILFAYFLLPVVNRLEKPFRGRARAIAGTYVGLVLVVGILGALVAPKIAEEAKTLAASLPTLLNRLASGELVQNFGRSHGWSAERVNQIQGFITDHKDDILVYGKALGSKLASPISHVWWLVLIPILTLFFLKQGQAIAGDIASFATNPDDRRVVDGLFADVNVMLGSYIRSQILLATCTLVAYTLVLSLMWSARLELCQWMRENWTRRAYGTGQEVPA